MTKILIIIAFNYNLNKLPFLRRVLELQRTFACETQCVVTTNTQEAQELIDLINTLETNTNKYSVVAFTNLSNPWLLPWGHKQIMYEKFNDKSITHFVYMEDDLALSRKNFEYWQWGRELLREYNLYPSLVIVEYNHGDKEWKLHGQTDQIMKLNTSKLVFESEGYEFINISNPYQGLFIYDRELMFEHLNSSTFDINKFGRIDLIDHDPKWPGGGVAERANYALTFESVPAGFTSRNLVCVDSDIRIINPNSFLHHLPNKYTNDLSSLFGKQSAFQIIDD